MKFDHDKFTAVTHKRRFFIGADHAGFQLKGIIKNAIKVDWVDVGAYDFDPDDDYPDFAKKLAKKVVKSNGWGILICGSGAGMCIAANRVKGARAVVGIDKYEVAMSREHNDSNILCLRARDFSRKKAVELAVLWLGAPFSGEVRHIRRIKKMDKP